MVLVTLLFFNLCDRANDSDALKSGRVDSAKVSIKEKLPLRFNRFFTVSSRKFITNSGFDLNRPALLEFSNLVDVLILRGK